MPRRCRIESGPISPKSYFGQIEELDIPLLEEGRSILLLLSAGERT